MGALKKIPKCLTVKEIAAGLKSLPDWRYLSKQKAISVEYKMKDFMTAIRKVEKIAMFAEKANHHPDLYLTRYRHLKVLLTTHEAGGVTARDLRLAEQIHIEGTR